LRKSAEPLFLVGVIYAASGGWLLEGSVVAATAEPAGIARKSGQNNWWSGTLPRWLLRRSVALQRQPGSW